MAATRLVLTPFAAELPSANFPQLQLINRRPVLSFDAATDETAYWSFAAWQGMTGTLTIVVTYIMASAISGNVVFEAAVEAVSDGDATDLDATTSFDAVNSSGAIAVPGTAGHIDQFSITLTNKDGVVAGDYVRLSLARDANHASDTATGDCHVLSVEVREG